MAAIQFLRINPAPVVAHRNTQLAAPVFDPGFDIAGTGMPVCVDDCFATDAIDFATQLGPQFPPPAFHHYAKLRAGGETKPAWDTGKGVA